MEKIIRLVSRTIFLTIIFLCLTACSTLNRVPLDVNQRQTIKQSNELLASDQEYLEVEKAQSNGAGVGGATAGIAGIVVGGVISAIVDNNTNKQNDKLFTPLKADLADEHFNQLMNQHLNKKLSSIKWLHLKKDGLINNLTQEQKRNLANKSDNLGDAIIYVDLSYKLSSTNLDALTVTADVEIYKKENPKTALIYKNTFKYIDQLEPKKTKQEYANIWSKHHGARARQSMNAAMQLLADAIMKDIQDPAIKPNKQHPTNVSYSDGAFGGVMNATGYLEEKIEDKYIIRTSMGDVVIVNEPFVKTKHNWRE